MDSRTARVLLASALALAVTGSAWAHGVRGYGGHHIRPRVGVTIGVPLAAGYWGWGPYGYWGAPAVVYPPYGYYAPPVVTTPPVYIERAAPAEGYAPGYWYWCSEPQGYYPTVAQCPGGWQPVAPQSPSTSQ